jgi:hypothetical protein
LIKHHAGVAVVNSQIEHHDFCNHACSFTCPCIAFQ